MCGIIGIVGKEPVADRLVDGLKRMEYRGYDSAGVCTVENGQLICDFKRSTPVTDQPPLDFWRDENAPVGYLPKH